jgi:hypothetical protein
MIKNIHNINNEYIKDRIYRLCYDESYLSEKTYEWPIDFVKIYKYNNDEYEFLTYGVMENGSCYDFSDNIIFDAKNMKLSKHPEKQNRIIVVGKYQSYLLYNPYIKVIDRILISHTAK